jgi:putative ABC transport system permease protein
MRVLRRLTGALHAMVRRTRVESDLDEELREYLDAATEEKIATGIAREDAIRAARVELGSAAAVKDWVRDVGWESRLESVWQDVRYASRLLRRNPGFALVTILTLALGIGGTTAIYSIVYGILFRPLPVHDEASLVVAYATSSIRGDAPVSHPRYRDWADSGAFDALAGLTLTQLDLTDGVAERVSTAGVTGNFFAVLGANAQLGRTLIAADFEAGETPVVISDALWRRRFAADPAILGRPIGAGQQQFTVVGVMPRRFDRWRGEAHMWVPIERVFPPPVRASRGHHIVTPIGRLRSGATMAETRDRLADIDRDVDLIIEARSSGNSDRAGVRLIGLREDIVPARLERLVLILFGAVALTWLVACANVSTLLMARGAGRTPEMAVRLAVGADRRRLVRQLFVESAVLGAPGGILGGLFAFWALRSFVALAPPGMFDVGVVGFDLPIVAFTIVITAATALVFGTMPAFRISKATLQAAMNERESPRARRFSNALIGAQIAGALVVLVGALLVAKSLVRMQQVDLGFDPARVLTFRVSLPSARYGVQSGIDDPRYLPAQRELLERLGAIPGVEAATIGHPIFAPGTEHRTSIAFDDGRRLLNGNPRDRALTPGLHFVGPRFFHVHGARLVAGREFNERDDFSAQRVVVVNAAMARLHWPGHDPIGQRVNFGYRQPRGGHFDEPWAEVIGVVADIRHAGVDFPIKPEIYRSMLQYPQRVFDVMLRTSSPERVMTAAREQVRAFDAAVPVFAFRPLADTVNDATATTRYSSGLLALSAALTSILCGFGVYSMFAYAVAARHRELGIRIALGAHPRRLAADVLWRAAGVAGAGLFVGLMLALSSTRVLAGLLYEVSPRDPAIVSAAACALTALALGAAWVPARRAARVDPIIALRTE